jgi:hypothetical protein
MGKNLARRSMFRWRLDASQLARERGKLARLMRQRPAAAPTPPPPVPLHRMASTRKGDKQIVPGDSLPARTPRAFKNTDGAGENGS